MTRDLELLIIEARHWRSEAEQVATEVRQTLEDAAKRSGTVAHRLDRDAATTQNRRRCRPGREGMLHYNVSFVKNLLSSNGQAFVCVQDVVAVDAHSPDAAVSAAKLAFEDKHSISDWRLRADRFEITPSRRSSGREKWLQPARPISQNEPTRFGSRKAGLKGKTFITGFAPKPNSLRP